VEMNDEGSVASDLSRTDLTTGPSEAPIRRITVLVSTTGV
jgi:hypothetical protein